MIPAPVPKSWPLTRLTIAGTATHVFFGLVAGVGMLGASILGPSRAAVLWVGSVAGPLRIAPTRSPSADRVLSVVNATSLAAVVAHLVGWPRRPTRFWLPWLEDCWGWARDSCRSTT
jgi:hypothetical protein